MKSLFLLVSASLIALVSRTGSVCLQDDAAPRAAARAVAAHIVGPGDCEDCHEAEVAALEASWHWKGFSSILGNEQGREIAKAMGIAKPKEDWRCLRCHATPGLKKETLTALGGVSCESCHGPAEAWMDLHDDYGDGEKEEESAQHAAERIAATVKAGMRRPDRVHELASACFDCHVVDDRKLVEEGEHPTGEGFELLSWSQGEVRHNYMKTDGEKNLAASPQRRRVLFLVGQLVALERLAPLVGSGTAVGAHAKSLKTRRDAAMAAVTKAHGLLGEASRLKALVSALHGPEGEQSDGKRVASLAKKAAEYYGRSEDANLAPLDVMLPKDVKGQPAR